MLKLLQRLLFYERNHHFLNDTLHGKNQQLFVMNLLYSKIKRNVIICYKKYFDYFT